MKSKITVSKKTYILIALCVLPFVQTMDAQETKISETSSNNTYHNQLFFNRFLINPTFSLVREDKSYLNILHRNQYATFDDNIQNYFIGFSNRINDNTAFGIGIYSQWAGVVQEFGFNANYATAVKLGEKSKLTFGANVTYFNEGLDKNRIVAEDNDTELQDARKESKIAIQPAVTLTLGKFDFGIYAKDLVKYNQTTDAFSTNFNGKSIKASLQYTHTFESARGLFEDARLMPLVQIGQNENGSVSYVGSILIDLPQYGWIQSTIDDNYGLSMGLGFNLSNKMSLGYLLEKDVMQDNTDLGWNHELSLAYTFKNNGPAFATSTEKSQDSKIDGIIKNYEEQILALIANQKKSSNENKSQIDAIIEKYETQISALNTSKPNTTKNNFTTTKKTSIDSPEHFAYSHKTVPSTNKIEDKFNDIVENFESHSVTLNTKKKNSKRSNKSAKKEKVTDMSAAETSYKEDIAALAYENRLILDELILRQDSIENARSSELEKKFETIVRILRNEVKANSNTQEPNAVQNTEVADNTAVPTKAKTVSGIAHQKFLKLPLKVINQSEESGVEAGYYVIANVYKTKKYLDAFMKNLKEQGVQAKQFYNKENGLYYVYLADYNYIKDAESAYATNLDGKYQDEKWILKVDKISVARPSTTATASNIYED
ncbi:type IX secretion system membrane protein PorP/SprF [Cellulophaga sp. F20128]|uniref:PorP/SprF family type IX secretion system membrane protein n=1 Tax=Cellulophaga sp. F20128 TaxID=2926413 RepID=UPI001FF66D31|nr:type IX secretion system membrane protein PorP/SprF [Cellulophaga sp. F20128]MCK0157055.1 type IX secretion system membrane protein PorP/SprF [Cellulophaga sp. F20128]